MVFTNTHFYCSDPAVIDSCIANLFILKEFEDVFELFGIHLVASSSKMIYESVRNVFNFEIRQSDRQPRNYLISGMAGCHNYLGDDDYIGMPHLVFNSESNDQSIVSIDIFYDFYKMNSISIPDFVSRDIHFFSKKPKWIDITSISLFFILLVFFIVIFEFTNATQLGKKYGKHKLRQRKRQTFIVQDMVENE